MGETDGNQEPMKQRGATGWGVGGAQGGRLKRSLYVKPNISGSNTSTAGGGGASERTRMEKILRCQEETINMPNQTKSMGTLFLLAALAN